MTCAELIAELQKFPLAKPVRVQLHSITHLDEEGEFEVTLNVDDAAEATDVSYQGAFVLIRSQP